MTLKSWHFLDNICNICVFWSGHTDDQSRSVTKFFVYKNKKFSQPLKKQNKTSAIADSIMAETLAKIPGISKLNGLAPKHWNSIP